MVCGGICRAAEEVKLKRSSRISLSKDGLSVQVSASKSSRIYKLEPDDCCAGRGQGGRISTCDFYLEMLSPTESRSASRVDSIMLELKRGAWDFREVNRKCEGTQQVLSSLGKTLPSPCHCYVVSPRGPATATGVLATARTSFQIKHRKPGAVISWG